MNIHSADGCQAAKGSDPIDVRRPAVPQRAVVNAGLR
jgi:hypothetical protein